MHLSKRWAIAAIALASVVLFGRMYVGAHLPLDLVGGAALGAIAGGVANLLIPPGTSNGTRGSERAPPRTVMLSHFRWRREGIRIGSW